MVGIDVELFFYMFLNMEWWNNLWVTGNCLCQQDVHRKCQLLWQTCDIFEVVQVKHVLPVTSYSGFYFSLASTFLQFSNPVNFEFQVDWMMSSWFINIIFFLSWWKIPQHQYLTCWYGNTCQVIGKLS